MALDKVITQIIVKTVSNNAKFNASIDKIIEKLKDACPKLDEIKNIIEQKNKISDSLVQLQDSLKSLDKISSTVKKTITPIDAAIKVIKAIPTPVSYPPGIGIPMNVIILLSDNLKNLQDLVKKTKSIGDTIPKALDIVKKSISETIQKLSSIDNYVISCVEDSIKDLSIDEKSQFIEKLGITIPTTPAEDNIINNMQPSTNNPIIYKDFKLILESNPNNKLPISSNRIVGVNQTDPSIKVISTLRPDGWSFGSSIDLLINEIKFEIDKLKT